MNLSVTIKGQYALEQSEQDEQSRVVRAEFPPLSHQMVVKRARLFPRRGVEWKLDRSPQGYGRLDMYSPERFHSRSSYMYDPIFAHPTQHLPTQPNFPEDVMDFVRLSGLPEDTLEKLDSVVETLRLSLREMELDAEVDVRLNSDPEFAEWQQIEISVDARADMTTVYERVRPMAYRLIGETFTRSVEKKILITFSTIS